MADTLSKTVQYRAIGFLSLGEQSTSLFLVGELKALIQLSTM